MVPRVDEPTFRTIADPKARLWIDLDEASDEVLAQVGAALGIGRIGSILGPSAAEFMRPRYTTHQLFIAFAVPAALSVWRPPDF